MAYIKMTHNFDRAFANVNARIRQINYATAAALTQTAKDVQTVVKAKMPQAFTLRRQWIVGGIRIVPADKNAARIVAKVFSIDGPKYMGRQETGGIKTGMGGGSFIGTGRNRLAVPGPGARSSKTALVRRADLPSALGKWVPGTSKRSRKAGVGNVVKGAFIVGAGPGKKPRTTRYGHQMLAVKTARRGFKIMYYLEPSAHMRPRLQLVSTGKAIMFARFPSTFARILAQAVANAR